MAEGDGAATPALFTLRTPAHNNAELCITEKGKTAVHRLTFSQVTLLNYQSAQAIKNWPVEEKIT